MNDSKWFWRKVVYAVIAGIGALPAVLNLVSEGGITGSEWISIAYAFAFAAWAKFSNPEKPLSPKPTVKG